MLRLLNNADNTNFVSNINSWQDNDNMGSNNSHEAEKQGMQIIETKH